MKQFNAWSLQRIAEVNIPTMPSIHAMVWSKLNFNKHLKNGPLYPLFFRQKELYDTGFFMLIYL